jgi:Glycosyl hydrolase family 76
VLAFVLAPSAGAASHAPRPQTASLDRTRALAAYAVMQRSFYDRPTRSYAGVYPPRGRAQAWPFSQALWATLDVAALPRTGGDVRSDLLERIGSLSAYSRPEQGRPVEFAPKYGGVGTVYNDDNLWIALGLLAATDVTHDPSQVATARQLFALVGDGWDTNPSHPCPGGVFWTRDGANRDRNTVTTANSALLALALYGRSGSSGYLAWARKAYEWTKRCLGRDDGLVNDHLDLRGTIDEHTWSYNQGAMIAAAVRLYHATGERRYLADATRTADAALASLDDPLASGEPPFFLAIFYRDLLELRHSDRAAIQAFADEAWLKARDSRTGLFHFGGRQPTLLDQAAMVQIYAELAR